MYYQARFYNITNSLIINLLRQLGKFVMVHVLDRLYKIQNKLASEGLFATRMPVVLSVLLRYCANPLVKDSHINTLTLSHILCYLVEMTRKRVCSQNLAGLRMRR